MSEDTDTKPTPEQVDSATPKPEPAPAPQTKDGPPAEDWEKRYQGAQRVISQRDLEIKKLQEQSATTEAALKELQSQTSAHQAEFDAKVKAMAEQMAGLTEERDSSAKDLAALKAYRTKMEALREFPDLLSLAETIPDIPDAEVMKKHLQMMNEGVQSIIQQKAQVLQAGLTPGHTVPANQPKYAYANLDDWQRALNEAAGDKTKFVEISKAFRLWADKQPQ